MTRSRTASSLATIGGLMQILLAFAVLFLPVFQSCIYLQSYPPIKVTCYRESYIQMGGTIQGYIFLTLMVVAGALAVLSSRSLNPYKMLIYRWLVVLVSVCAFIFADWRIGFVFLPGTLVVVFSVVLARRERPSWVNLR